MTYEVTYTDTEGKQRTETVELSDSFGDERDRTLVAYRLDKRGHEVKEIQLMREVR